MDLVKYSADYSKKLNEFFKKYFTQLKKDSQAVHPSLANHLTQLEEFVMRGGKRIRATLVLLGYQLAGGRGYKDILPISAAIEILHAALLIHDDFIDQDAMRRGKPTIHRIYGNKDPHFGASMAILMGDTAHRCKTVT